MNLRRELKEGDDDYIKYILTNVNIQSIHITKHTYEFTARFFS